MVRAFLWLALWMYCGLCIGLATVGWYIPGTCCWARVVVVFFGPSSCVSVGVAGVRGGQATQCVSRG
jgi:hypothetical protein